MEPLIVLGALGGLYLLSRLAPGRAAPAPGAPIAWGAHPNMTADLLAGALDTAKALDANPEDLLTAIFSESHFNGKIRNPFSGAIGLIQFMPFTLQEMGRSADEIAAESLGEQMRKDVYKYLAKYKGKLRDATQTKLAIFYPKAIGAPMGAVIGALDGSSSFGVSPQHSKTIYAQNQGADRNHDGRLTVSDIDSHMKDLLAMGRKKFFGLPQR